MKLMRDVITRAQAGPRRIVYAEGADTRIIQAARQVLDAGIATPILIGTPAAIAETAGDIPLAGISISGTQDAARLSSYVAAYAAERGVSEAIAAKLVRKPLCFGGMMVARGDADGMVAGVAHATGSVIQSASLTVGLRPEFGTASSFFIMLVPETATAPERTMVFADCAVNVQPTAAQLAAIGVNAGRHARDLVGLQPKIAFLSFATLGSATHADTVKVAEATAIARKLDPSLDIDGELQADAALDPNMAAVKAPGSQVAGRANVLVFPDLNAGNIAYKLVQHLANAKAIGPVMLGFRKPVNDLSRGATVEDIVNVTAITVLQAQNPTASHQP